MRLRETIAKRNRLVLVGVATANLSHTNIGLSSIKNYELHKSRNSGSVTKLDDNIYSSHCKISSKLGDSNPQPPVIASPALQSNLGGRISGTAKRFDELQFCSMKCPCICKERLRLTNFEWTCLAHTTCQLLSTKDKFRVATRGEFSHAWRTSNIQHPLWLSHSSDLSKLMSISRP